MESMESDSALPDGDPASREVVFSELIDRWLRDGERLHEAASEAEGTDLTRGGPVASSDGWRARTAELWRTILERHRLEALVAVGLLPLMLFLVLQGHAAGHPQAAPAPAAVRAVVTAPDLPTLRRRPQPAPPPRAR